MKIYHYWVEKLGAIQVGDSVQPTRVYGYSDISHEDAEERAEWLLSQIQLRVNGEETEWGYQERPIREEIVREFSPENIVTRNRYGALVLNSEKLFFIDVDANEIFSEPKFRFLGISFGGGKPLTDPEILDRIRKVAARPEYREVTIRVYKTCAGYRLLLPRGGFEPGSEPMEKLMADFNSDALYAQLCCAQHCYRARLTPKPYRIGQSGIKAVWPTTPEHELRLNRWLERYQEKSEHFATCHYLESLGPYIGKLDPVIGYHDEMTRAATTLPLA